MLGRLPEDLSAKMLEKYTAEQKELTAQMEKWQESKEQADKDCQGVEKFIQRLKKWNNIDHLTR